MQSLLRRTQRAVIQNKAKAKKHNKIKQVVKKAENVQELRNLSQARREFIQDSRNRRWEEWYLGPLAPQRQYTEKEEKDLNKPLEKLRDVVYDSKGRFSRIGPKGDMSRQVKGRKQSSSTTPLRKIFSFKEGDRVVVVAAKGPAKRDQGKISAIIQVNEKERWCIVDGMNMNPSRNPSHRAHSYPTDPNTSPDGPKTLILPNPIPMHLLRRVLTRIDPDTGIQEDIIIGLNDREKELAGSPTDEDIEYSAEEAEEFELDEEEEQEQEQEEEAEEEDIDTGPIPRAELDRRAEQSTRDRKSQKSNIPKLRPGIDTSSSDVQETTFEPPLLSAPMPASVIDELRNKYSVFRTRHDPEYLDKLRQIDKKKAEYEKWAQSGGGMLASPLREMSLRERRKREREGKGSGSGGGSGLSVDTLQSIGEVMARNGVRMTEGREREVRRNLKLAGEVGLARNLTREGEGRAVGGKAVGTLLIDNSSGADAAIGARPEA